MRLVQSYIVSDYKKLKRKLKREEESKSKERSPIKFILKIKLEIDQLVQDTHEFVESLHKTSPLNLIHYRNLEEKKIKNGVGENYSKGTFNSNFAKCIKEIEMVDRYSSKKKYNENIIERKTVKKQRKNFKSRERKTVKFFKGKNKKNVKRANSAFLKRRVFKELDQRVEVLEVDVEVLKKEKMELMKIVGFLNNEIEMIKNGFDEVCEEKKGTLIK